MGEPCHDHSDHPRPTDPRTHAEEPTRRSWPSHAGRCLNFLERERGFASPYTDGLNRYAGVKGRPKTLPLSSSMTCLRSLGAGEPGTSRRPVTMR
jgi:hypothetical protein